MHIQVQGIDQLAHDMDHAGTKVTDELYPVVKRALQNIKTGWRRRARASAGAHGKHYPRAIDYDIARLGMRIDGEVGPNAGMPQGGMGRGFEYGSIHTPPKPDGDAALAEEEPKFAAQAEAAVLRALG
jgi:hypothetical protein